MRERLFGAALAVGPAAYGLGVLKALRAGDLHAILGYRSIPGWFGVTGWLHLIGRGAWASPYAHAITAAFAAGSVLLAFLAWRGKLSTSRRLVAAAALPLVAVPAVGPGYGPQYFYWFWPLVLVGFGLGARRLRRVIVVFGFVAAATYLFEYGVASFLGAFLAMRLPPARDWLVGPGANFPAFTLAGTPLWLGYLALLWALAREVGGASTPGSEPVAAQTQGVA
jgi:hypothetical protein